MRLSPSSLLLVFALSAMGCSNKVACPAGKPPQGGSCPQINFVCETGGTAHERCSTVATCVNPHNSSDPESLTWSVADNSTCSTTNDNSCAVEYNGNQEGKTCPTQGVSCDYSEGRCTCSPCAPGGVAWQCRKWTDSLDPACPSDRPAMGTACAINSNITCHYDNACTVSFGTDIICLDEHWQPRTGARATCGAPVCGIGG